MKEAPVTMSGFQGGPVESGCQAKILMFFSVTTIEATLSYGD